MVIVVVELFELAHTLNPVVDLILLTERRSLCFECFQSLQYSLSTGVCKIMETEELSAPRVLSQIKEIKITHHIRHCNWLIRMELLVGEFRVVRERVKLTRVLKESEMFEEQSSCALRREFKCSRRYDHRGCFRVST